MPPINRNKEFNSIKNFRNEANRIIELVHGLITVIRAFENLPDAPGINMNKEEYQKQIKKIPILNFNKEKIYCIYELGFIRLFASFEAFMYEYLKELYLKYPRSIPIDKKIQISDILEWNTKKSIQEFIVDYVAIENSYDISIWERTLKNTFGIDVFKDKEQKSLFEVVNVCRNITLHSGGKVNAIAEKEFIRIFSSFQKGKKRGTFKITKWDICDTKMLNTLLKVSSEIVDKLENSISDSTPKANNLKTD